ncbi:leukocyte elastase inhibitor-like [Planococcus citri]|uniref:leukocyte elastase inhibitor-like n=1 Tax=Planococcus citri TaxID=170843 RepID=UPI0031F9C7F7
MLNYFSITFLLSIAIHSTSSQQDIPSEYTEAVRNGIFNFGVRLNSIIQSENTNYKNIVFSPFSIYTALALLHYGSDSSTRDELGSVLGIPRSYSLFKIHETIQSILKTLHTDRLIYSLLPDLTLGKANCSHFHFAQGIFAQNGVKLKRSYVTNTKPLYGNELVYVDFQNNGQETADIINTYVAKHTDKRAPDLYTLTPPPSHTKFIVESCAYFNAIFELRFHKKKTKYGLFYMDNGNTSIARLMHRTMEMPYANITSLGIQAGEIIFGDNTYSLFLVLQRNKKQTLTDFMRSITTDTIKTIIRETANRTEYVDLLLPRFNIRWSQMVTSQLTNLGLKEMFADKANFKNMFDETDCKIDDVGHSTYINVMEHGTDSNATKPIIHRPGLVYMEREFFHLNEAFFFFVYHRTTKTVLYYGVMHDPNEDGLINLPLKSSQ